MITPWSLGGRASADTCLHIARLADPILR